MTDDTLSIRAMIVVAEANEILHRDGPVQYINLKARVASNSAEGGYLSNAEDSMNSGELELAQCDEKHKQGCINELARGYKMVANSTRNSRYYCYSLKEGLETYAQKCDQRAEELIRLLK